MKIALSWRALTESASHHSLVEHLHQDHGHTILVLRENGNESTASHEGIPFHTVRTWGGWHPSVRVLTGWSKTLEAFRPEVLLGLEEPYSVQSALFLQWALRRSIPFVFLSCQNIDRLLPYPFRVLESWVLQHSRGAWFLNEEAAARSRRRGFRGVGKVIPLGVEIPERPSRDECGTRVQGTSSSAAGFTVGYAGRLVPEKGVDDLIRACSLAGVRLLVAGDGPERARLERLACELHVETVWLGRIESTNMREVYSQMHLLVLPSVSTPRWKEQFGRVLVEAMAHGVPVVGSSSGEIPRVIGEAGLVFPERDSDYLSACLKQVREDSSLQAALSLEGKRRVSRKFGWDRIADLLNDLILDVVYRNLSGED